MPDANHFWTFCKWQLRKFALKFNFIMRHWCMVHWWTMHHGYHPSNGAVTWNAYLQIRSVVRSDRIHDYRITSIYHSFEFKWVVSGILRYWFNNKWSMQIDSTLFNKLLITCHDTWYVTPLQHTDCRGLQYITVTRKGAECSTQIEIACDNFW